MVPPIFALPSPTLPPATTTNTVLAGGTVVDPACPWPEGQDTLHEALPASTRRILLTHHHGDHWGGAADLARRRGLPVLAHPLTAARLEGKVKIDQLVQDGEVLDGWTLVHTPGHAPGHLALRWEDVIIAGDMVAGEGTIVLEPEEGDLQTYLDSLALLQRLAPRALIPAHGPTLGPEVLERYIQHRHARTAQIEAALPGSPPEIVQRVYGASIPDFIRPVAERQVLCHLIWLEARGRARRDGPTWN